MPLTAVFERLPLTTIPLHRPAPRFAGAEADQLAVGVDLVVVAGGVRLGRAEALGEADEHDPGRGGGGDEVVVRSRRPVGQPDRRQAAVDVADDLDALGVEVEHLDRDDADDDGDQRAGHDRRVRAAGPSTTTSDIGADGERAALGVAEVAR